MRRDTVQYLLISPLKSFGKRELFFLKSHFVFHMISWVLFLQFTVSRTVVVFTHRGPQGREKEREKKKMRKHRLACS